MERGTDGGDSPGMDVVKVFIEEPVGLEVLVPNDEPDARRRSVEAGSLEAFLARGLDTDYARAYLAGTHLAPPRPRVGLTALADADVWLRPLLAWAGDRPWQHVAPGESLAARTPDEAAHHLRQPAATAALALGDVPPDALAATVGKARREALPALRSALDADPRGAVLYPEPAHDGHDWSVFTRRPLREPLVDAFRQHPAPEAVRFIAPYRRARGEHTFYLEQWALDALPDWAEPL